MRIKDVNKKARDKKSALALGHHVTMRLDQSLPLQTPDFRKVEQTLMRITEFAPDDLIAEALTAIANFGDDQARRGYILGQEDLMQELVDELG